MFFRRVAAVTLTAAVTFIGVAGPARAQQSAEAPSNVPVQVGPLALAPVMRLTDIGYDNNVYNRESNNDPKGDFTTTLSPSVEAWLRLPHARLNGRSEFDFYYFKELTDLRGLDTDTSARLDLPLNRFTPFFAGTLTDTRHRQNLEIDAITRRRNEGLTAGANLRMTAKVSFDVYVLRSKVAYQLNSLYLATDLARELNYTSAGEGLALRYVVTPFTTVAVAVERQRDRFEFAADRAANSLRVTPTIEFNPLALVSGSASVGFRRRTFLSGQVPEFNGTTAFADLHYTLLGRTRFGVAARRDLEYSYLVGNPDYILSDVTASVTQRLGESWDVGGTVGRAFLTYSRGTIPTNSVLAAAPNESYLLFGMDAGYRLGRTRVGFHLQHSARQSDVPVPFRGYQRLRVGSTVTYVF
jgi:hypothetical protein